MGFYIRKSFSLGPFRLNVSKSGFGVSTGIKGLRYGIGPKGHYIHMGRGGIYYRQSLSSSSTRPNNFEDHSKKSIEPEMKAIDSGDVFQMKDASATDLINELNAKKRKITLWPVSTVISLWFYHWLQTKNISVAPTMLIGLVLLVGNLFVYYRDLMVKTTIMFYDLEGKQEDKYQKLHDAFIEMSNVKAAWHFSAEGHIFDQKRNAGASTQVSRHAIKLKLKSPPYVKTNIQTPMMPVGKQKIYFFPDRILVFDRKGVGTVFYKKLHIDIKEQRFIESGFVPRDAKIVDKTWLYVNKNGTPDKRFSNNREFPIALYEEVHFSSDTGLNEVISLSKLGVTSLFKNATLGYE